MRLWLAVGTKLLLCVDDMLMSAATIEFLENVQDPRKPDHAGDSLEEATNM